MAQKATFADEPTEDRNRATFQDAQPPVSPSPGGQPPLFTRAEMLKRGIAPDITEGGESFTRGLSDVGQGLKQLYLMATDPGEARKYTTDVNKQIAEYQQRRGSGAGLDFARMGGGAVATIPALAVPGGQATLLPRLAMGGLSGALSSGAEFSPSGTFGEKAVQAGLGATVGAVLPEVASGAVRGLTGVGQAAVSALRPITGRSSTADILSSIQQAGQKIDFTFDIGKVSEEARSKLIADAKAQLKTNNVVDPLAIVRRQDFERLGIDPTRGQVLRDPRQYQMEQNLAQIEGVGDPLLQRLAEQQGAFGRALEAVRPGETMPAFEAGSQIIEAIGPRVERSGTFGELGKNIDEIYKAARSAPGADAELPYAPYRNRISDILENFEDSIPSPIIKRINEFAPDGGRDFSIKEAVKFRELLNSRIRASKNPDVTSPLTALKTELNSFFTEIAESSGPDAVEAIKLFREGIGASAERAQAFQAPGLRDVVAGKATPEDFVKKFVIGGKINDLKAVKSALLREDLSPEQQAQNLAAWDAIRNQSVQYMMDRAVREEGKFSQAAFKNAFEQFGKPTGKGNSKLEILFQPEEIGTLSAIRRASEAAFSPPPSGGVPVVNRSGTAAALANLAGRIPLVGTGARAVGEAFQQSRQAGQVARALDVEGGISPAVGAAQAQLRDAAAQAAGNLATRTVPPMSAPLIQQLRENDERRRQQIAQSRGAGGLLGR